MSDYTHQSRSSAAESSTNSVAGSQVDEVTIFVDQFPNESRMSLAFGDEYTVYHAQLVSFSPAVTSLIQPPHPSVNAAQSTQAQLTASPLQTGQETTDNVSETHDVNEDGMSGTEVTTTLPSTMRITDQWLAGQKEGRIRFVRSRQVTSTRNNDNRTGSSNVTVNAEADNMTESVIANNPELLLAWSRATLEGNIGLFRPPRNRPAAGSNQRTHRANSSVQLDHASTIRVLAAIGESLHQRQVPPESEARVTDEEQ